MTALSSLLFNVVFFSYNMVLLLLLGFLLPFPRRWSQVTTRVWTKGAAMVIKGMLAEKKNGKFLRYVQSRRATGVQVLLGTRSRDSSSTAVRPSLLWAIEGAELRARMKADGEMREMLYRNAAVDLAAQLAARK